MNRIHILLAMGVVLGVGRVAVGVAGAAQPAVLVPVTVAPGRDLAELGRTLSGLRTQGAAGVLLRGGGVDAAIAPALAELTDDPRFETWVVAGFPGDLPSEASPEAALADAGLTAAVRACSALPCTGLALVFPPPQGEALPRTELAPLLARRRQGESLADAVRRTRKALAAARQLALCVPLESTRAETSRGLCVDVDGLIRDGTVTTVVYAGNPGWSCHRARLLTDRPLSAGVSIPTGSPGEFQAAVLAACSNPTLDALWLWEPDAAAAVALVRDTLAAGEAARRRDAAVAEALAAGRAKAILDIPEKGGNNQATVHGVAQCFTPAAGGLCTAVQIYAALRLKGDAAPPPVRVELRADRDGRPGEPVLAAGVIPPTAFGPEPSYRWGTACFEPAPALVVGQKYWIHLPANEVVVWRLVSAGATPESHSWSSRYDYAKHSWVLRVICEPNAP